LRVRIAGHAGADADPQRITAANRTVWTCRVGLFIGTFHVGRLTVIAHGAAVLRRTTGQKGGNSEQHERSFQDLSSHKP
jgi:hypothetical protein